MITAQLQPHPASANTYIRSLEVSVERQGHQLALGYQLKADMRKLRIPMFAHLHRADELWQHSCFELFARTGNAEGYQEFNFSPSGGWAHYRFSQYRQKLPDDANIPQPVVRVEKTADRLELNISVPLPPGVQYLNISAVIEDHADKLSYWALHHPTDTPDFHHPDAFTLELE